MIEIPGHLAKVLAEASRDAGCTPPGIAGHDVQFYRTDADLTSAVVDFLAAGVRAGQPIIVIATEPHRRAFADKLRLMHLDPDQVLSGRLAVWLDAEETLAAFMEGSLPNRELFNATVGSVFERLLGKRYYLVVRAYGEMVDVLRKSGNLEGALALEQLWNELAAEYKYSLLCGYCLDNFLHEAGATEIERICDHHARVVVLDSRDKNVA